ncbi:anti-phage ZorAB system protein ZorA [Endozoicomonas sp. 4G]|uniref:anti-phage ZorAB system protein ZorA n=1 Tax=Endozoicomonas sp. 4G TaxID=2872754 RepID=UPI00207878B3|nr:anti-phage ZorAB system protein ZorA [Endozoicomonas sp. 4G]
MASESIGSLDLGQLVPEWGTLLNGFPATGPELSAWFVFLLIVLTVVFIGYSVRQARRANRKIHWLRGLLADQNYNTIAASREELRERAQEVEGDEGHLWLEFDETLVEVQEHDRTYLYNTYDAAYFFNSSTLASGITESRMLAAVPGFLTALGVIGTFVGLQLGLSELNIASNVSIEEMKGGIAGVINGAKFAFMTSVWGVLLSVLFNFGEKFIERRIKKDITIVQETIDKLFPRLSAESQLQRIAEDGEQSRVSLQGLAEQIGEKMQESLFGVTAGIRTGLEASLEKIMAPAINKLVDETSDSNQKALEGLVERFMDKFGEQGAQQRQAMDQTSDKVNAALDSLNTSMTAFIGKLEASQNASGEREQELVSSISLQVSQLVEQGNEQKRVMAQFVQDHMGNMSSELNRREEAAHQREEALVEKISTQVEYLVASTKQQNDMMVEFVKHKLGAVNQTFSQHQQDAADREAQRNQVFVEQTSAIKQGTDQLLERIEQGMQTQINASNHLLDQGRALQSSIDSSVRASAEASSNMKATASELNASAESVSAFGSQIRATGDQLSNAVTMAVENTGKLAEQNHISSQQMNTLRSQLVQDAAQFKVVIGKLQNVVELANDSFDKMSEHQLHYVNSLKQNVEELAAKMTNLLEEYATQANSQTTRHLNVWAEGTNQYAATMNTAAQALSGVVDEIEMKLGR